MATSGFVACPCQGASRLRGLRVSRLRAPAGSPRRDVRMQYGIAVLISGGGRSLENILERIERGMPFPNVATFGSAC